MTTGEYETRDLIKYRPGLISSDEDKLYHQLQEHIIQLIRDQVYEYATTLFLTSDINLQVKITTVSDRPFTIKITGLTRMDEEFTRQILPFTNLHVEASLGEYPQLIIINYPSTMNELSDFIKEQSVIKVEPVQEDETYRLTFMEKEYMLHFIEEYDMFRDRYAQVLMLPEELRNSRVRDPIRVYLDEAIDDMTSKVCYHVL